MSKPIRNWDDLAEWWRAEVATDPVYREDIAPILKRLLRRPELPILELGCGDGQWLRRMDTLEERVFGCDQSSRLLGALAADHPVVLCELPSLNWLQAQTLGTAFSVFVLDLIEDSAGFFEEAYRAVRPGGTLSVIINHPAFTAPGSGPFMDPDSDVFWRWGEYLHPGESTVPAGSRKVVMYHRPIGTLLTSAAQAGWSLDEMIEAPLGGGAIEREPLYGGQEDIPRFLGVRWRQ